MSIGYFNISKIKSMKWLYNIKIRVESTLLRLEYAFCCLVHFCLKNSHQTFNKLVSGLKVCAEFVTVLGVLGRGLEGIAVCMFKEKS